MPYTLLEQSQRVKEVYWMAHPGSSASREYLVLLQDCHTATSIDVFPLRSLTPLVEKVCLTSLRVCKMDTVVGTLNADMRAEEHIPAELGENELYPFTHPSERNAL